MNDFGDRVLREHRDAERLFGKVHGLVPRARARYVEAACADNPQLRGEVLSLLEHAEAAETFFGHLQEHVLSKPPWAEADGAHDTDGVHAAPGPASASELPPGTTLGRHRIIEPIGAGGMGTVYRAHDPALDRDVALKLLPPHLTADPEARRRFLVEARAAAALDHPNIYTVHEVGEAEDGRLFIAMARYEGETLKQRLARGPLPVDEAVACATQLAGALAAAHVRGIVHRDVKPGNVMLLPDGSVKLLDFGLARMSDVTITRPGLTPGTIAYMSPEQVAGEEVDHRTDLWSLGVVIYEMLTSVRPFRGEVDRAVLSAIAHEEPEPLPSLRPETPDAVARAVERLLEKKPEARYRDAEELRADLERARHAGPGRRWLRRIPGARPFFAADRRRARLPAVGLALAGLVLTGTAVYVWDGLADPPDADPSAQPTLPAALPPGLAGWSGPSIAVLPFEDLSPGGDRAWFADGIAEEILSALSRVPGLQVSAPQSSFAFRGRQVDVREIGSELGVRSVLDGSVRTGGDSVWVTARLIDAATGFHHWSLTSGKVLTAENLQAIQLEIARDVAAALEIGFRGEDVSWAGPPDDDAYDRYRQGRSLLRRVQTALPDFAPSHREDLLRSVELSREAVGRSPDWAPGWAALGEALHWTASAGIEPEVHYPESRAALERAIELDPEHAEAHAALAFVLASWEHAFREAEATYLRALALGGNVAWHGYGTLLHATRRFDEAISALRNAEAHDPLSTLIKVRLLHSYVCAERYEEAISYAEEGLTLGPERWPLWSLSLALERTGRVDSALARIDAAEEESRLGRGWDVARALLHARAGRLEEARALIRRYEAVTSQEEDMRQVHAAALLAVGEPDDPITLLDRLIGPQTRQLILDCRLPEFQVLEEDPRYAEALRSRGLVHR